MGKNIPEQLLVPNQELGVCGKEIVIEIEREFLKISSSLLQIEEGLPLFWEWVTQ